MILLNSEKHLSVKHPHILLLHLHPVFRKEVREIISYSIYPAELKQMHAGVWSSNVGILHPPMC
jgi:hypothetical protein